MCLASDGDLGTSGPIDDVIQANAVAGGGVIDEEPDFFGGHAWERGARERPFAALVRFDPGFVTYWSPSNRGSLRIP